MKFIPLHTRNTAIVYKNSLCSAASILVLIFVLLSVMIPVLLVSVLSPYSGIAESRVLFEQPRVGFQFKSIFLAQTAGELVACSSFVEFNERMKEYGKRCAGTWVSIDYFLELKSLERLPNKRIVVLNQLQGSSQEKVCERYWSEDLDHDGIIDRAHFELKLDDPTLDKAGHIKSFDLALFFEASLKHKCSLSPPAMLAYHLNIPEIEQLSSGTIRLKAELQLKQYIEFTCPFPGRNSKTHFRQVALSTNESESVSFFDISEYKLESLLKQLKANPAYFHLHMQETYFQRDLKHGLRILLDLNVLQVPARYHLSVWERLGQFWLYFASFFGISFYVMNKLKDFLFGQHIIRSWEIIPWKKLY